MKKTLFILIAILLAAASAAGLNAAYQWVNPADLGIGAPKTDPLPVVPVELTVPTVPEEETVEETAETEPEEPFDDSSYEGTFYIKVNVQANTVTVYAQGTEGMYDHPIRAMLCSTGDDTMTEGIYTPGEQHKWANLFGDVYGQYSVEIEKDILFHSVPYTVWGDPGTLEYWEYDQLGTSCSKGCVRLCVADAKWIYDNTYRIQGIEMYCDEDPGPLGKPELTPISENEEFRGWDPTDPDPENLWNGGSGVSVYTMEMHLIEEAKYNS